MKNVQFEAGNMEKLQSEYKTATHKSEDEFVWQNLKCSSLI